MSKSKGIHWKDQLRQERIRRNWRQRDLAERLETTVLTVQRWERGSHQPSAYFRVKLCALFGKSAEELGLVLDDQLPFPSGETSSNTSLEAPDLSEERASPLETSYSVSSSSPLPALEEPLVPFTALPNFSQERETQAQSTSSWLLRRRSLLLGLGGLGLTALTIGGLWSVFHSSTPTLMPLAHLFNPNASNWVNHVAWSPQSSYLAVAAGSNTVAVWDIAKEAIAFSYPTLNGWVNDVSWSKENCIAVATAEQQAGSIQIWKFSEQTSPFDKTPFFTLKRAYALRSICWSPDGNYVALSGHTPTVEVWDPFVSHQVSHYIDSTLGPLGITRVKWSPSGRFLACAADDGTARVWEASTGKQKTIYYGHQGSVQDLAWSPDERSIASCSTDKTCHVWGVSNGRTQTVYRGHTGEVEGIDWSPRSTSIASASADRTAHVWTSTGRPITTYGEYGSIVETVCWSAEGTLLAIGMQEEGVEIWQAPR